MSRLTQCELAWVLLAAAVWPAESGGEGSRDGSLYQDASVDELPFLSSVLPSLLSPLMVHRRESKVTEGILKRGGNTGVGMQEVGKRPKTVVECKNPEANARP